MFSSLVLLGALASTFPVAVLAWAFGFVADKTLGVNARLRVWRLGWLLCILAPAYVLLMHPYIHAKRGHTNLVSVASTSVNDLTLLVNYAASAALLIIFLKIFLKLSRLSFQFISLARTRQSSQPADSSTFCQPVLSHGQKIAGMRRVPDIRLTGRLSTVALVGFIRPAVMVPFKTVRSSSSEQLALIIAHEMAHFSRGDHWLVPLERIVDTAMWFNPLARRVLSGLDAAREEVCDAVALLNAGRATRTSYAHALLKALIDTGSPYPQPSWISPAGDVIMRVNAILEPKANSPRRSVLGFALLVATITTTTLTGTACAQALAAAPSVPFAKITVTADEVVTSDDKNVVTWRGSPTLLLEGPGKRPLVKRNGQQIASLVDGQPLVLSKKSEVISYKDGSPEAIAHGARGGQHVLEIRDR